MKWHARRRDERGAAVLLAAVMVPALMVSGAFVVDLGMQRVARADAQAVADMVALDLARELDGRTVSELDPVLDDAAAESAARNADIIGSELPELAYELGQADDAGFTPMTSGVPNAVRVRAEAGVAFAFAGVTGRDSGEVQRSASAASSSTACFRLGTFVAAVNSGDSTVLAPLNELLGVNLDLVSYKGLAAAKVRLADLAADPLIGSPEALLDGTIIYRDLLRATLNVLSRDSGGTGTVAVKALDSLIKSSVTTAVGPISLANVLNVAPTDVAALEVGLNVLDIIGSARLSDGQHFVGVPNIQGGVPGVGFQYTGGLYIVSAAELACGMPGTVEATADTAQLGGVLDIDFTNLPSIDVTGLGTLQTPKGSGSLRVDAGSGTGTLVSPPPVRCGAGTAGDPTTFGVEIDTGLASYALSMDLSVAAEVKGTDLLGFGLTNLLTDLLGSVLNLGKLALEVELRLDITTQKSADGQIAELSMPPNDVTPVRSGGEMGLDVASVVPTVTAVKIAGKSAPLDGVLSLTRAITSALVDGAKGFVEKSLTPLVANINNQYVGPVARMLGIRLGGADVFAVGATCGQPRLVG